MVMRFIVIVFLSVFLHQAHSQTAKDDFNKINEAYAFCSRISINVVLKFFDDETTKVANTTETGTILRQGRNYYSDLFDVITIRNERCNLLVDTDNKTIRVEKPKNETASSIISVEIDSALKFCSSVAVFKMGANLRMYKLTFNTWEFKNIEIYFSTTTFLIEKLHLIYPGAMQPNGKRQQFPPRVEIEYHNDCSDRFNEEKFSEQTFISITNENVVLTPAYQHYQLLNHFR